MKISVCCFTTQGMKVLPCTALHNGELTDVVSKAVLNIETYIVLIWNDSPENCAGELLWEGEGGQKAINKIKHYLTK